MLPAPALSQAGHVVTVNETGDGYELRPGVATDKTLAVQGAAADAAAVGRALTTPNLLVNSDFTSPVNTGGKTTYNTANADTIDCWYQLKATNVSIGANGITLTASTAAPATGLLSQKVPGIPSGKAYTFALKDTDGNVYILSRVLDSDIDSFVNVGNSVYMRAISVDGNGVVTIGLYEGSKTFVWAALYKGEFTAETLPLYRPRGYSAETAACGAGPSMELLWKNASPSSAFAAQTLALGLSGKNLFLIKMTSARTTTGMENECWRIYSKGSKYLQTDSIYLDNASNKITESFRAMTISDTGITFGGGYIKNSNETSPYASDGYAVPLEIYSLNWEVS